MSDRTDGDRDLPPPGRREWDEPASEAPETIEGAVRTAGPGPPGAATAAGDEPDETPEPDEPG